MTFDLIFECVNYSFIIITIPYINPIFYGRRSYYIIIFLTSLLAVTISVTVSVSGYTISHSPWPSFIFPFLLFAFRHSHTHTWPHCDKRFYILKRWNKQYLYQKLSSTYIYFKEIHAFLEMLKIDNISFTCWNQPFIFNAGGNLQRTSSTSGSHTSSSSLLAAVRGHICNLHNHPRALKEALT